jgi:two-component system sensor histidine kinase YesM
LSAAFPETEQILSRLVGFETVNGNELPAAAWLGELLAGLGMRVEIQRVGEGRANVFAEVGRGDALMLSGHLDVVPAQGAWSTPPFELVKKQAELSALQSQINPHFLYNTLDCIKGIGHSVKSQDIVNITSSLSFIMRYSIKGGDIVSVKNEIECVENYLKIISIRFMGKHQFQLDIDECLMDMKMIKFILQPIVENAIYHGLEPKLTGGLLKIKGFLLDDRLICFEIFDNGKGMTAEELECLNRELDEDNIQSIVTGNKERSIGLININGRIKFKYGMEFGLKITSRENEGTSVRLNFPCIDNRPDHV